MALQGNIETFALQDVLRLLASTKKTGCLRLEGSRGEGTLLVQDGQLVGGAASEAPHADGPGDVLFELLRFKEGDFEFDADAAVDATAEPADVESCLTTAEEQLDEWKGIEAVVPSLGHWVELSSQLPGDDVTIDRDRWKVLVTIAGGISVGGLGDELEQGELPVSRNVRDLVDLGLVSVGEPRSEAPSRNLTSVSAPGDESAGADDGFGGASFEDTPSGFDPDELQIDSPSFESVADDSFAQDAEDAAAVEARRPLDQNDATEIARQLANLSPKAAKAVAAAAKATTVEEREALLAGVDDAEDPINRDLLIKFLGSVNG